MTRPNQGLSSLALGVKMRDPGNEVVKQAAFDLQQKETGSKTVAIATSKYASCGAFLSVQRACQIPIVLRH